MNPYCTSVHVGSKVPERVKKSLIAAVENGGYLSVSDFVRDAIKEKLQHDGFLKITTEGVK